jgi:hypothetical protein
MSGGTYGVQMETAISTLAVQKQFPKNDGYGSSVVRKNSVRIRGLNPQSETGCRRKRSCQSTQKPQNSIVFNNLRNLVRDQGVGDSNPLSPTNVFNSLPRIGCAKHRPPGFSPGALACGSASTLVFSLNPECRIIFKYTYVAPHDSHYPASHALLTSFLPVVLAGLTTSVSTRCPVH